MSPQMFCRESSASFLRLAHYVQVGNAGARIPRAPSSFQDRAPLHSSTFAAFRMEEQMARVMRALPAVILVLACGTLMVVVGSSRSVAAQGDDSASLNPFFDRAERLCRLAVPDVGTIQLSATPLVINSIHRSGEAVWSVQVSNARNDYVGETIWDSRSGDLVSASWRRKPARHGAKLPNRDLANAARVWISIVTNQRSSYGWIVSAKPVVTPSGCVLWARSGARRYRIKLEPATGQLITLDRRDLMP